MEHEGARSCKHRITRAAGGEGWLRAGPEVILRVPMRLADQRTLLATAATTLLALLALAALGRGGWPGEPNGCRASMARPTCFCEAPRAGLLAQPANSLSNLGFIAVGLAIAASADRTRRRGADRGPANPMTRTELYPSLFAGVTALLGPGSMALHASLTRWGGKLDVASMYLFAAWLVAYGATRARRGSALQFLLLYGVLASGLVASKVWTSLDSNATFGLVLAMAAGSDAWARRARPELRRDGRFLVAAAALFGVAFAVWLPSLSGGALCDPESWLQGHALWHLLCAGAAGSIFLYLRSEREVGAAPASPRGRLRPARSPGSPPPPSPRGAGRSRAGAGAPSPPCGRGSGS